MTNYPITDPQEIAKHLPNKAKRTHVRQFRQTEPKIKN